MVSAKQGGIKYHFLGVFGITWPGIEPWSPGIYVTNTTT